MEEIKIAAVIVLYNPDIKRLKQNISAVSEQVDQIVLIDNASDNIEQISNIYKNDKKIRFIYNSINVGIAKALNQGMEFCKNIYKWVLTLDQDSVVPPNLMEDYKKYFSKKKIALITPIIHDRNEKNYYQRDKSYEYIQKCITSGSLTNSLIWEELGGFDEKMFIDVVDFEYCYRAIWAGYRIIRVNTVQLLHECGNMREVRFFSKTIKIFNHSAWRKYFFARNWLYIYIKHKGKISITYLIKQYLILVGKIILFEDCKREKFKSIFKGIYDGYHML